MAGLILQSMLGTVDFYFVAKLGTSQTAALGIGSNLFYMINVFSALVATGVLAKTARRKGEGETDEIARLMVEGARLALLIGALILVLSWNRLPAMVDLIYRTSVETTGHIADYLNILVFFIPLIFLNSALRSSLQAQGDTRTPLLIFGLANLINMALDPVFIFRLGLGIAGAALATGLSVTVAALLITRKTLLSHYASRVDRMLREALHFDGRRSLGILRIGFWDALQQSARPVTAILMFRIVYLAGGDIATAAFSIGGQLLSYTFIILNGLMMAVSILVGQKLGEGLVDEVEEIIRFALKLSFLNMVVFAVPYLLLPKQLLGLFTDQPEVVAQGLSYMHIVYVGVLIVVVPIVYGGALKGAGYTYGPMVSSLFANVIVKIGLAYLLAIVWEWGVVGVWWAIALSVPAEALGIGIMARVKDWKATVV